MYNFIILFVPTTIIIVKCKSRLSSQSAFRHYCIKESVARVNLKGYQNVQSSTSKRINMQDRNHPFSKAIKKLPTAVAIQ